MPTWFYRVNDLELGPVTEAELQLLHAERQIDPTTPVRESESSAWTSLAKLMKSRRGSSVRRQKLACAETGLNHLGEASKPDSKFDLSWLTTPPPPTPEHPTDKSKERNSVVYAGIGITGLLLMLLMLLWWDWSTLSETAVTKEDGEQGGRIVNAAEANNGTADIDMNGPAENQSNSTQPGKDSSTSESISSGQANPSTDSPDKSTSEEIVSADGSQETDQAAVDANPNTKQSMEGQETREEAKRNATDTPRLKLSEGKIPDARFAVTAPGEATFFGIRSAGRRFVFVVDCSSSMAGQQLNQAQDELIACLERLPVSVHFTIIFFENKLHEYTSLDGRNPMKRATTKEVDAAKEWIRNISAGGGTDVELGMTTALRIQPAADVIFLLTDGEFSSSAPDVIRSKNGHKATINTVAFKSRGGEPMLKIIANESGGDYKYVP